MQLLDPPLVNLENIFFKQTLISFSEGQLSSQFFISRKKNLTFKSFSWVTQPDSSFFRSTYVLIAFSTSNLTIMFLTSLSIISPGHLWKPKLGNPRVAFSTSNLTIMFLTSLSKISPGHLWKPILMQILDPPLINLQNIFFPRPANPQIFFRGASQFSIFNFQ